MRENGNDSYNYTYTDHLGSILTITKPDGNVVEQNFDAWGRRRDANSWVPMSPTAVTGLPDWLYRGYTGHEHLDQFGLINMNARLYDPVLGRMISPDNFANGAFGTQGYNRYSYAHNNPLSYIDPSGNEPITIVGILLAVLKGAAISAGINATMQVIQNGGFDNFNWGSFGMAALQGGIGGGLSNVIGGFVQGLYLGNFDAAILGASLHTISGGVQSAIFGGDPFQGMVSGTIGSVAGSIGVSTGLSKSLVGSFVIGGVPAAITAQIMGGDPFQAFITGGTVAAFNHYLHNGPKKPKVSSPKTFGQQVGDLNDYTVGGGSTLWGFRDAYINRLDLRQVGSRLSNAIGIKDAQGMYESLRKTKVVFKNASTKLGIAGFTLASYSYLSDGFENGFSNMKVSTHVNFGVGAVLFGGTLIFVGTAAAPFIATGALIYGTTQLGSQMVTGKTLEQHIFDK